MARPTASRFEPEPSTRSRILQATLQLIADEGLDAVRHRKVADMADVSLGSTTYHFASRDDLVEAAFAMYLDEATAFLRDLETAGVRSTDPVGAITRFVTDLLKTEFQLPGAVQTEYELILYAGRNSAIAEQFAAWETAQRSRLEDVLRSAGAVHPTDGARTLMALIRGLEIERLTRHAPIRHLRRRLEPVVRSLMQS